MSLLRRPQLTLDPSHIGWKLYWIGVVAIGTPQSAQAVYIDRRRRWDQRRATMHTPLHGISLRHQAFFTPFRLPLHSSFRYQFSDARWVTMRHSIEWNRRRPRAQRSLPIVRLVVDDLEAPQFVPPDFEDPLAADTDPKPRELVRSSIGSKRSGQLDRDAVILELAQLLLFAVDRQVRFNVRQPRVRISYPADRLRSLQPRFAVGSVHCASRVIVHLIRQPELCLMSGRV